MTARQLCSNSNAARLDAVEFGRAGGHSQHVLQPAAARGDRGGSGFERGLGDQHARAAVAHEVGDLGRRGGGVDAERDRGEMHRGEIREQVLGPVSQQKRDPIAAPHPERVQRVSGAAHPRVVLIPGPLDPFLRKTQRETIGIPGGGRLECRADRRHPGRGVLAGGRVDQRFGVHGGDLPPARAGSHRGATRRFRGLDPEGFSWPARRGAPRGGLGRVFETRGPGASRRSPQSQTAPARSPG